MLLREKHTSGSLLVFTQTSTPGELCASPHGNRWEPRDDGPRRAATRPERLQVYANSVFKDTAGQAVDGGGDLAAGLKAWQDRITAYGTEQGFTISAGS
jgi:hypothetical protein